MHKYVLIAKDFSHLSSKHMPEQICHLKLLIQETLQQFYHLKVENKKCCDFVLILTPYMMQPF